MAGKATITSGLLLRRSEALKSLRHYLRHKAKDVTPSITWRIERGVERTRDGRAVLKAALLGKLLRDGMERIIMGFSKHIDTIFN